MIETILKFPVKHGGDEKSSHEPAAHKWQILAINSTYAMRLQAILDWFAARMDLVWRWIENVGKHIWNYENDEIYWPVKDSCFVWTGDGDVIVNEIT